MLEGGRSIGINVSPDGTSVKPDFNCYFGSVFGDTVVTSGKWYYEVEMITDGLFQIGWANDKCRVNPIVSFINMITVIIYPTQENSR